MYVCVGWGGWAVVGYGNSSVLLFNQPCVNPEQNFNVADEYEASKIGANNYSILRL